jgi:hypothetical protein
MQPIKRSEFWERTIKEAGRESARLTVRHAYRPVGILIVVSFLVLAFLLDHNVPVVMSVLITMLVSLLAVIFS